MIKRFNTSIAGGKVEAIKAKYALSKEIEAKLTTL